MKTLQQKGTQVRSASTPQQVVGALKPLTEEAKRISKLADNVSSASLSELGTIGGNRLKELANATITSLKNQYETEIRPKLNRYWDFTNIDRARAAQSKSLCETLAQNEQDFRSCLSALGIDSTEVGKKLNDESSKREQVFKDLATKFVLPASLGGWGYY
jgi:hypothetical protein